MRLTNRPALRVAALAVGLAAVACGSGGGADAALTPAPAPDLRMELTTDDIGPGRTDLIVAVTNVGTADVLGEVSVDLPANKGADRNSGPTKRAKALRADGSEASAGVREPKTLAWVPERVRAGATLTWEIAVRCFDQTASEVSARMESTTVGSVVEAPFPPIEKSMAFVCPPPRPPGR